MSDLKERAKEYVASDQSACNFCHSGCLEDAFIAGAESEKALLKEELGKVRDRLDTLTLINRRGGQNHALATEALEILDSLKGTK